MKRNNIIAATFSLLFALLFGTVIADEIATMRSGVPLTEEPKPSAIPQVIDSNIRAMRNYPMQPPLIPHDTRGYEVNLNVNKCMTCHGRRRTEESLAPMISVTHFMDRDGNFLAEISPRRYFCNQCHVIQTTTRDILENDFRDMDELMQERESSQDD